MSELTTTQPAGTPTWIDLGIPDLDRAMTFYGALFGWEFDVGPAEFGHYTQCLLRGSPVAAIRPNPDPDATDFWWNVYFATDDCDAAAARARDAGGSIITGPMDVLDQGRTAIIKDTTGAQCGLWQAGAHIGCEIVNEPNALLRNDLVTAESKLSDRSAKLDGEGQQARMPVCEHGAYDVFDAHYVLSAAHLAPRSRARIGMT